MQRTMMLLFLLLVPAAALLGRQPEVTRNSCADVTLKSEAGPEKVCIGVYVVRLSEVDLKTQSYFADFYLWLRWRGDEKYGDVELVNSDNVTRSGDYKDVFDGFRYSYTHVQGRFRDRFDLTRYPLDHHELTIDVESTIAPVEEMEFVADDEIGVAPGIQIPAWNVLPYVVQIAPFSYPTDFGDLRETKHATYSRFSFRIPIRRPPVATYLKTFLALFISVGIGLVAGVLKPTHVEPRLGIGVASIFGVVSSHLVIEENLPQVAQFTLADRIHIAAIAMVFLSILLSAVVYRISTAGLPQLANRIDAAFGIALFAGFVIAVTWFSI